MDARVVDGIAGATNVEEGDPLVPGGDQLGLSGLQVIGVCYFDIRAMTSSLESLWVRCFWSAKARRRAPAPIRRPIMMPCEVWYTAG